MSDLSEESQKAAKTVADAIEDTPIEPVAEVVVEIFNGIFGD